MRIFPIAERLNFFEADSHLLRENVLLLTALPKVRRDHGIIAGRVRERFAGQTTLRIEAKLIKGFELFQDRRIIRRIAHNADVMKIFTRCS